MLFKLEKKKIMQSMFLTKKEKKKNVLIKIRKRTRVKKKEKSENNANFTAPSNPCMIL